MYKSTKTNTKSYTTKVDRTYTVAKPQGPIGGAIRWASPAGRGI